MWMLSTRSAGPSIRTQHLGKFRQTQNCMSAGAPTRSAGQLIRTQPIKSQNLEISTRFRFTLNLLI